MEVGGCSFLPELVSPVPHNTASIKDTVYPRYSRHCAACPVCKIEWQARDIIPSCTPPSIALATIAASSSQSSHLLCPSVSAINPLRFPSRPPPSRHPSPILLSVASIAPGQRPDCGPSSTASPPSRVCPKAPSQSGLLDRRWPLHGPWLVVTLTIIPCGWTARSTRGTEPPLPRLITARRDAAVLPSSIVAHLSPCDAR